MCGNCFRIKVCNRFAPNKVAVKCGICKECRATEQNAWSFRLRCELEECHRLGWKIGFLTLTYDDDFLPLLPLGLSDVSRTPQRSFPCFNKKQCQDFIISLRKSLYDNYGIGKHNDRVKYLLASEFGKTTSRPHYHMVISWPPLLDSEEMLKLIKSKWPYGHVFPRHHLGGVDSHGYRHMPFEVTANPFGCCKYISKYICKDLDFFNSLEDFYPCENADLSNYFPFHLQSRSLGLSLLVRLSDDEKIKYVRDGFSFVGEDKMIPLPLYFKRKLFFSPMYVFQRDIYQGDKLLQSDHIYDDMSDDELNELGFKVVTRRLVRRECTDFFKKYYAEIYEKQHDTYTKLFSKVFDENYLVDRGLERDVIRPFLEFLNSSWLSDASQMAHAYLMYFGLPITKCFDVTPSYQWFLRYDSKNEFEPPADFFLIDADFYDQVNTFVPLAITLAICTKKDYSVSDKIADSVADFWKSAI